MYYVLLNIYYFTCPYQHNNTYKNHTQASPFGVALLYVFACSACTCSSHWDLLLLALLAIRPLRRGKCLTYTFVSRGIFSLRSSKIYSLACAKTKLYAFFSNKVWVNTKQVFDTMNMVIYTITFCSL